jgi:serine/threonine-protein kinase
MGAVYEVIHLETQRRRALKVMLPGIVADPDLRARFKLEATVTANVESEHIVETFDAGVEEVTGAPFIVMELLRGEDLGALLARRRRLPPDEVVTLLFQASLALDKTHGAGIVHRDLKPENLFVTLRDDGSPRLKVLDFGIAKVLSQGAVKQSAPIGTPLYMSPEQVLGNGVLGPASDRHALAHIAYTLLVGEPYWEGEQRAEHESVFALFVRIAQGVTEPPSERARRRAGVALPPGFDAWLARAAAVAPEDRFPSAASMVAALAGALEVSVPRLSAAGRSSPSGVTVHSPVDAEARRDRSPPRGLGVHDVATTSAAVSSDRPTAARSRSSRALTAVAALALAGVSLAGVALGRRSREQGEAPAATSLPSASGPTVEPRPDPVPLPITPPAPNGTGPAVSARPEPTAPAASPPAASATVRGVPPPSKSGGRGPAPPVKPRPPYDPSKEM